MKKSKLLLVAAAIMLIGQPVFADEKSSQDQSVSEPTQMMQKMHQRMQTMRQQMEQIHATDDAKERKRLMQEHMQGMRGAMMMMSNMNQAMMRPGHEGGAGSGHQRGTQKCMDNTAQCGQLNDMANRQGHMEQRMGMMQMMMQQMMEHNALKEGSASQ